MDKAAAVRQPARMARLLQSIQDEASMRGALWTEQKLAAADPIERGIAAIFTDIAGVKSWTYHD